MKRRDFTYSLAAAGLASVVTVNSRPLVESKKAFRLNVGDLVGLIAPAGLLDEERIEKAKARLKDYGFRTKEGTFIRAKNGYLAGTDAQRLHDLHSMYKDPKVKAIWCIRGGYGCTRLLENMDFQLIRKNPKVLIGFSDITALLNAIYQETGLIGFHGPVASSNDNAYSRQILRDLVMFPKENANASRFIDENGDYQEFKTIRGGKGSGIAVGGNLSLMAAMTGTPHEIDYTDKIVFIEDVGEEPYRIDRMLTQLLAGGKLGRANGIVLGQFRGCNPDNPERSLSLSQVLEDRLSSLGIPLASGFNFGHVDHNFTFPVGGRVSVDFDTGKINFLELMVL